MKRFVGVGLAASAAILLLSSSLAFSGGKAKPEPSVTFAKSWDAAVEEAKLLNLPIVVHSHGFY